MGSMFGVMFRSVARLFTVVDVAAEAAVNFAEAGRIYSETVKRSTAIECEKRLRELGDMPVIESKPR